MNQPSETMLIVLRSSKLLFAARMVSAIAAVVGVWWGGRHFGLIGAAAALTGVQVLALTLLQTAERIAVPRIAAPSAA